MRLADVLVWGANRRTFGHTSLIMHYDNFSRLEPPSPHPPDGVGPGRSGAMIVPASESLLSPHYLDNLKGLLLYVENSGT